MANNRATKEAYEIALKEMIVDIPLSKISVKDITSHCELSRNSFYYHFADKYELMNWIFYSDIDRNVKTFHDPSKLSENFVEVCRTLAREREFYLSCFQYTGQNSLYETLYKLYFELWKLNLERYYEECQTEIQSDEIEIMARFNTHAIVGIISEWVKNGMHSNCMGYFKHIKQLLDMRYLGFSGDKEKITDKQTHIA